MEAQGPENEWSIGNGERHGDRCHDVRRDGPPYAASAQYGLRRKAQYERSYREGESKPAWPREFQRGRLGQVTWRKARQPYLWGSRSGIGLTRLWSSNRSFIPSAWEHHILRDGLPADGLDRVLRVFSDGYTASLGRLGHSGDSVFATSCK